MDLLPQFDHRQVVHVQLQRGYARPFEQSVALFHHPGVCREEVEVARNGLGDDPVDELAALGTPLGDQVAVRGGNDHQRVETGVFAHPVDGFPAAFDRLFGSALQAHQHRVGVLAPAEIPLEHHEILAVADVLPFGGGKITLGKTQVVHRVQDVGLAGAVGAGECVDLGREVRLERVEVLEIDQADILEIHKAKVLFFPEKNSPGVPRFCVFLGEGSTPGLRIRAGRKKTKKTFRR